MGKSLLSIVILFFVHTLYAQTFNGTGGTIPDNGATATCFPITVSGVGTINGSYGVASVCMTINHTWDSDLEISLKAPDGTVIPLSIQNGGSGDNYTGTCFTGTATNPVTSGTAPFSGNYLSEGTLGNVNNGQNANGSWRLCIQDVAAAITGTLSSWSITFSNTPAQPLAPPANDDPCNAITLPVNSTCTYSNYTNAGAGSSLGVPAPGCSNYAGGDVWFKVTVPASGLLNFDTQTGSMTDGGMAIYSGTCNALTLLACDDDGSTNGLMPMISTTGLTPGSTIWIRMWEYGNDNNGTFGICVSAPTPPPPLTNDNACTALPLTVTTACSYDFYTNAGATGSTGVPAPGCASYSGGDVWFSLTVPPGGAVTINTQEGTMTDGGMALYSGSNCSTLSLITCNDDGSSNGGGTMPMIAATGLTPGSTVWVRMWEYGNDNNGTFGICATIPVLPPGCSSTTPAGNTCASATPICNFNGYCGNTSSSYTADYWPELFDAFDACLGGGTSIENNSFISFVASGTSASFNVWVTSSLFGDGIQMMFYDGGCGSGPVTCHGGYNDVTGGPNLISATGLIPGNTYYLMVDGVAGDVCDYTFDPISGVDALNVTPTSATICNGASINLTASGGNGVYSWSPATGLNTTSGATVTATPSSTIIYTVTSTGTGACPVALTKQVNIAVVPPPAAPTTSPITYCQGSAASALTASGTNLLWYTTATGGTGSATPPTPSTASTGTVTYWVSQSLGSCESPRTPITVTVSAALAAPAVNSPVKYCQGAPSSVLTASGSNLLWYTTATGGTGSATPPTPSTASPGSVTYYVSQSSGGGTCESPRSPITVQVNSKPVIYAHGTNPTCSSICDGSATVDVSGGTGPYSFLWSNGGTSQTITGLCTGTYTVTVTDSNGCASSNTPLTVPGCFQIQSILVDACSATEYDQEMVFFQVGQNPLNTSSTNVTWPTAADSWNGYCTDAAFISSVNATITGGGVVLPLPASGILPANANVVLISSTPPTSANSFANLTDTLYALFQCPGNVNGHFANNTAAAGVRTLIMNFGAGCTDTVTYNTNQLINTNGTTGGSAAINNGAYVNYSTTGSSTYLNYGCTIPYSIQSAQVVLTAPAAITPTFTAIAPVCQGAAAPVLPGSSTNATPITGTWSPAVSTVTSGSTTYTFTPAAGQCASTTTLSITVKAITSSVTTISVCPSQLPYTWNSNIYNAAGTFKDTLVNAAGCDSVVTLNLTLKAVSASTTNLSICPSQLPYTWNSNVYNAAGTFKDTLVNAAGCDSVVTLNLTLKAVSASTTNLSICPSQLPYTWNSNVYNAAGTFKDTLVNAAGCDSVVTLNLTVNTITSSTSTFSICPTALPFNWNGNNYTASGTYSVTLLNAAGCDSVATLILTVPDTLIVRPDTSICQGASVMLGVSGGSGSYLWTASPADPSLTSPGIANPVVTPGSTTTYTVTSTLTTTLNLIVNGDFNAGNTGFTTDYPYIPNNISKLKRAYGIVTSPNQFENTFINCGDHTSGSGNMMTVDGSDINGGTDKVWAQNVSVIPGQNYTFSYWMHTINASASSPAVLSVWINGIRIQGNTAPGTSACNDWVNISFTWNSGAAASASIWMIDENTSGGGNDFALDDITFRGTGICNLTKNVTVIVKPITFSTTNVSVCPSQLPYTWNSNVYNAAGTFKDTLINSAGCDSVVTLNLTVKAVSASTTNVSICPSQLPYSWNSNVYNAAGIFKDTLINSAGCDSVVTLNLTVKAVSASTTNVSICPSQLPYSWNTNIYNAAGTFKDTLVNAVGCDSVVTLNLTVKAISASITNVSICPSQLPYTWNSNIYNAAGTFKDTLINAAGCDSVATLNLTVKAVSTSTTNVSICPSQLPYSWNSNIYNAAGIFKDTLVNAVGCDSVVTLNLIVKAVSASITNISICPSQLPYSWNSNVYNAAGTFKDTLVNAVGCDSVVTLNLTVKVVSTSITNVNICPAQLPYTWNSNIYNAAGTFKDTLVNAVGCDSVVTLNLTVKAVSTSITNVNICPAQLPYTWNSNIYNAAGTFKDTLVNAVGCDSVATLNLTVKAVSTSITNVSICPSQLPYSWNSNVYNAAGTFKDTLVNAAGCDSVVTLNLTVKSVSASTTNVSICPSQLPYTWNINIYNAAGTFKDTLVNAVGCDSVVTLNLTVKAVSSSTTNVSICPSQLPYTWNSNMYNAAGTFKDTLVNAVGCDSVVTLNLTVKAISFSTTNISICPAQLPYIWNSNVYNAAGTFKDTLVNAVGCDSVATLNLIVKAVSASTTNISICPSQLPYTWNSNIYNAAGTFKDTLVNVVGCDSVVTLNLTVKAVSASTTNVSICPSQLPYTWNSNIYNAAGTFKDTLVNAVGCDSVVTLNLTIKAISSSTTNISICPAQLPYTWNSNVYNAAGIFKDTLVNAVGCDSVVTLNLTVKAISASTTNVSVCPSQLPYTWNSNVYNAAGTFKDTLVNAVGCDSVVTLNLTVKAISSSTTNVSICPSQLPYTWNSNIYNAAGTFKDTLVNVVGCDSVVTLNLTVKAVSISTTNVSICPAQLPYSWNSNVYNAAGIFKDTLVNAVGCDSVVTLNLTVKAVSASTTNISVCTAQLPYNWNSNNYNSTGAYTINLINAAGCDSIATLQLTVKAATNSSTNISICQAQLPYNWNGNSYNTGGNYPVTLINAAGCDSIATLNLLVNTNTSSIANTSVCPAQLPYIWNGNSYNSAGSYSVTLSNASGCDSVATLHLTVSAISSTTTNVSVCPAQLPYTWNSHVINTAGTFADTLIGSSGCDSVSTLALTVKAISVSTTNASICPAQLPYTWNGNIYTGGGTYKDTLINAAGCDSIATLNLTVKAVTNSVTNVAVCPAQLPYTWNGNSFNATGVYTAMLINASGCDSIATLNLTVKTVTASTTIISICPAQLPYSWNGNLYNAAGTFKDTLVNAAGCDSVITLNLTVKAASVSTTNISICPSQLPYTWNSNVYNLAGTFKDTLVNAAGCDSVITLNLAVKAISTSTSNITVCPAQLPYNWNGNAYNTPGTFKDTLVNAAGCDSIATLNLTVNAVSLTTTNISICPSQLPYIWNGQTINAAGNYADTLIGSSGCDSISNLTLSLKAVSNSTTIISICPAQLPYSWNGNIYNTGGTFKDTLVNAAGCDSIATLNLTVNAVSLTTTNISICPSQLPYTWNGQTINAAGNYADTLTGSSGCDSISNLTLSLKAVSNSTTNISICPAQLPYSWNGNIYNAGGTFKDTLVNAAGCDSVVTLNLTIKAVSTSTTNISICPAQLPYIWNSNIYNTAGSFKDTLVNAAGCDSVVTLNLTVKAVSASITNVSICPNQLPYTWNSNVYNAAGTFKDTLVNVVGCDSVVTLNLTVKVISASTTNVSICNAQLPFTWNSNVYNTAGSFKDTLVNAAGCDSVVTLNLIIKAVSTSTTNVSICPAQLPYTWNSNVYNTAGTFKDTLVNAAGCDSVVTLNLTVKAISTSTTNVSICPAQLPYTWNGNVYNAAGNYSITLTNVAGCDSAATLNLVVKSTSSSTTNITICPIQLPYSWNGNSYNAAGNYSITLTNGAGCDSIATLNLTVNTATASTSNITVCPAQLPYNWNGNNYTIAGSYSVNLLNTNGCDSVATLNLAVNAVSSTTSNISICPSQLPYSWSGHIISVAGSYSDTLTGFSGCDSVSILVLTVKATTTSTTNISICTAQLPYSWNGNSYNSGGAYNVSLINAAGCDSTATLNLTVKANSTSITNITVCPSQLPYLWNGNSFNATGNYTATLINAAGCDSIATLNLTVNAVSSTTTNISICPSQLPYTWNGQIINVAGNYADTLIGISGCDSISNLVLTVKVISTSTTNITVCPAQLPYSWNGNIYAIAGIFKDTLVNATGCDSIAMLNLTVNAASSTTTNISICPSQLPYTWNGQLINAAGNYADTLIGSSGCDSISNLIFTVKAVSTSTTNITICPSQLPYSWNGNIYNAAGIFKDTLVNAAGCDSIVTLNLTVNAVSSTTTNISICPSQLPYTWNGQIINAAGNYADTLIGSSGCDSISNLVLTVKAISTSTTNITVCPAQLPYSWNGNSYSIAGSYNINLINAAGCDSIATLNLTVNTTSLTTTNISICPSQLPYNWNGQIINAAGNYADTLIGSSGCDSISNLVLNVKAISTSTTNITVCPAQLPYSFNGNTYAIAGSYNITLINSEGCDSIATLNLTVNAVSSTTINISICPSQLPYTWNGQTINASGNYADTLIGSSGCDSISNLVLTAKVISTSITNITVCPAQLPYSWNGNLYAIAGTFKDTLVNAAGCDSIATLNLTMNTVSSTTTNISICPSQLPYTWNGQIINAAGNYADTLIGSSGCDSISNLVLTVKAISTSTTNITVCPAQLPYSWNGNTYAIAGSYNIALINTAGCDSIATLNLTVNAASSTTTNISICPSQLPYNWNGQLINTAGNYADTLIGSSGCDSISNLALTVKVVSTSTTNVVVCPAQLPYSWNGNSYTIAGSYNITLINSAGCDSIATLNLTVNAASSTTTNISICPSQLPYNWNGQLINAAGNYADTLIGSSGCDSISNLVLTVKMISTSITNITVCPAQLPYSWNGNIYNAAGIFKDTLMNTAGCDSIATLNLTVNAVSSTTSNISICPSQLPYTWNGQTINAAGNYADTLIGSSGCDSISNLVLTVKAISTSTTNITACPAQLPYSWNGNTYTIAGSYNITLINAAGCDSIATLNLTVNAASSTTINISICPSQLPYTWNGQIINAAGNYADTLIGSSGCDSISNLVLTVKVVSTSTTNVVVCAAQLPYSWNGNIYNAAGIFKDTLVNAAGCDSIATLNLTVNTVSSTTTNTSICPSQLPYIWNGQIINVAGNYADTLIGSSGCDSISNLVLTVKAISTSTTNITVCPAQLPYSWNGNTYTIAGTFNNTLVNAAGCDSIATLNLTVNAVSSTTTNISICPSQFPYTWNGQIINAAGNYADTLIGSSGCDSISNLVLTVKAISTSTTNITVCPAQLPYSWNGNTYTIAGTFNDTLVNAAGCDSIATLNLTVNAVSLTTTNISICPSQLPYTWNGQIINAAGNYADTLIVSSGCDSISNLVLTVKAISTSTTNITVCPAQLPYSWNGNTYTIAGSYNITLINAAGCDSIATLNLMVNAASSTTTNISICPSQLPYTWNGQIINAAGNYADTLIGSSGCDSISHLVLIVKAVSTSTTNITVCPAQLPYSWNGNIYNAAGIFKDTLVNAAGCDSIASLNLTVNAVSSTTTNISICPSQLPYTWNWQIINAAGNYADTLIGSSGCDSISNLVLTVKNVSTSTTTITVCPAQLPYSWNGNTYTISGSYNITLINAAGCDSIATLNLTVNAASSTTTSISICPSQLPYNWNGQLINAAGNYADTLIGSSGCDSISNLVLTVKAISTSITNITVCPAQLPYSWNGNIYNIAGIFKDTLVNAAGCDSIATLNLTVNTTSSTTTNISICPSQLPYTWNGQIISAAGNYADTLIGSSGCDSISNLVLTVKTISTSTTNITVCPAQLPYSWNGNTYTIAGSYNITLTNAAGCDSITTLHLTVKAASSSTTNISICAAQLPYTWNGNTYNTAGNYNVILINAAGCDSIATLHLTVKAVTSSTTNISICAAQLPYTWNGNTYNAAGNYNVTLTNAAGCDSITTLHLTVKAATSSTTNISICAAQLPYAWNSITYNAAGNYNVTLTNAAGCDSIATLHLTVKAATSSTTNISICAAQLPYAWNGNTYNAAGNYNVTLTNAAGCDSIATLHLTIKVATSSTTNISICAAQLPYTWNGNTYNAAGNYNVTLINAAGCDSIATLHLTAKAASSSTTNISICAAQLPYSWNGNTYNAAGSYNVTLTNAAGCDSIATLHLTIKAATSSTTNISICAVQLPYAWNGNTYNTAGNYNVTLINAAGCDSIATLHLTIKTASSSTTNISICAAQLPYSWNSNTYNAAGNYNVILINAAGCDSIATLHLTVKAATSSTTNISICAAQLPYAWNGNTYNAAGNYNVTLTNAAGCDSIATLALSVKASSSSTTNQAVCTNQLPYTWNGNQYNSAGTYLTTLVNAAGCDSLATLVLGINPSPVVALGNDTSLCPDESLLLYPGSYDHYLWQDLSTLSSYKVTQPGNYAVTVSNASGCEATADINVQYLSDCGDIFFPTAITPDGDGKNDFFGPLGRNLAAVKEYSLYIYNRYGELVFSSNDPYKKWDGIYKRKEFGNVNFVWYSKYLLNGKHHKVQKGNLVVIR